ncbi:unnamed protein product [Ambrosiozyma monospora]|uniref:Folylpolyglutamate synthase n=1 Tax=Ambrosiozyma monospora TaxID=43982 RepID=A0A9W6YUM4_AMBMO|nr:unnamed protein product [Ambrosiozyma monospora]
MSTTSPQSQPTQKQQEETQPMLRRSYKDAIGLLNSLQSNFATIQAVRQSGKTRNEMLIPEMVEWTRRIGYEPSDFNKLNVIHVTGTKGKGSTCAFVQSILSQYRTPPVGVASSRSNSASNLSSAGSGPASGLESAAKITKIGLYTSPHLKSVRERVMINGKPISEELFAKYFFEVWDRLTASNSDTNVFPNMGEGVKPAYFRYVTLLSFHAFMKEGVDTAIYEVGVGGEYDSTNIMQKPTACGITTLGIDHTVMLGNTLEEIAWNKSGIFKEGAQCFSVEQPEEAMKVIEERALEKKASRFTIVRNRSEVNELKLGLNGEFQYQNASMAVALCEAHLSKLGFEIDHDNLSTEFVAGLEQAKWPGRCQILPDPKKQDELTWFIDGAHTKESIANGSKWFTTATNREHKRVLLFNQQTRDIQPLIAELYKKIEAADLKFDHVIFTTNVTWASGNYSADLVSLNTSEAQVSSLEVQTKMAGYWNELDKKSRKHIFHDIETSVNFVRTLEGPLDVFVCGSLHLVGGFLVVLDGKQTV